MVGEIPPPVLFLEGEIELIETKNLETFVESIKRFQRENSSVNSRRFFRRNFVNLTPHTLVIKVGVEYVKIPPSGKVARVCTREFEVFQLRGFPFVKQLQTRVVDLPEQQEGVFYITSAIVRKAVSDRWDVISPGKTRRDNNSRVISAESFVINGGQENVKYKC